MLNIKEIALKVVAAQSRFRIGMPAGLTQDFAEALIESYKAELLKEVGEPVGWTPKKFFARTFTSTPPYTDLLSEYDEVFTSDQVAAAILKATKPLEDQLATAEQRVAEACAAMCSAMNQGRGEYADLASNYECEDAIRQGEWRKFVKEV